AGGVPGRRQERIPPSSDLSSWRDPDRRLPCQAKVLQRLATAAAVAFGRVPCRSPTSSYGTEGSRLDYRAARVCTCVGARDDFEGKVPHGGRHPIKWHDTPSCTNVTAASKFLKYASLGEFSLRLTKTLLSTACCPMHAGVPFVRQ